MSIQQCLCYTPQLSSRKLDTNKIAPHTATQTVFRFVALLSSSYLRTKLSLRTDVEQFIVLQYPNSKLKQNFVFKVRFWPLKGLLSNFKSRAWECNTVSGEFSQLHKVLEVPPQNRKNCLREILSQKNKQNKTKTNPKQTK